MVSADTIYSQLDSDTDQLVGVGKYGYGQFIGNNLSGLVRALSFKFGLDSGSGSGYIAGQFVQCAAESWGTCGSVANYTILESVDGDSIDATIYYVNLSNDVALDPTKYYAFTILQEVSVGTNRIRAYGSSDEDSYTDGKAIDNDGGNLSTVKDVYFEVYNEYVNTSDGDNTTHIISLEPVNASTTPTGNDVYFEAKAWIADEPSFWDTIEIDLYYRDFNSLSWLIGSADTSLYNGSATTTGLFSFSTTTSLADGYYRVTFQLMNSTLGGLIVNPFGGDIQSVTHEFTVGSSTFIGTAARDLTSGLNSIFASTSATSTSVLLGSCNPFSGQWNTTYCITGLLVPDQASMQTLVEEFKTEIMSKAPWGYITRLFAIISGTGSSTPPVLVFTVPDDEYFSSSLRNKTITFDPWNVVSDGSILEEADGFGTGNLMDTFMPWWKIIVYGGVVIGVVLKLLGMSGMGTKDLNSNFGRSPYRGVKGVKIGGQGETYVGGRFIHMK